MINTIKNKARQVLAVLLILAMMLPVLPIEAFASNGLTAYVTTYGNEITLYGNTLPDSTVTMKLTRISDNNMRYTNEIKSDSEGSYKLMFDVDPGEYKLLVGAIGLTVEKNVTVTDIHAGTATVRAEGLGNTLLEETRVDIEAGHTTYIDTIKKALDSAGVDYEPEEGDIINGIGPELEGLDSSKGWQWMVNGVGGLTLPTDLISEYDSLVMVVGDIWNPTITELNVSPGTELTKGGTFTVKMEQYNVDEFNDTYKTPVVGQTIRFGSKTAVTDEIGEATFTADATGTFTISCEPVTSDGADYTLIRPAKVQVTVKEQGSSTETNVYLSVDTLTIGGGYEVRNKAVEWERGDTVYSILVKGLGEENIRASEKTSMGVYVEAIKINGKWEGEFDHGRGSGWMVNVNGYYIPVSAGYYRVDAGDKVNWRYTTNYGNDLGTDIAGGSDSPKTNVDAGNIKNEDLKNLVEDIVNKGLTDAQIKQAAKETAKKVLNNIDYDKMDGKSAQQLIGDLNNTMKALTELTGDVKVLDSVFEDIIASAGKLIDKAGYDNEYSNINDLISTISYAMEKNSSIPVSSDSVNTGDIKNLKDILSFNDKLMSSFEKTGFVASKRLSSAVSFKFDEGIVRINSQDLASQNMTVGLRKSAQYTSVTVETEKLESGPANIKLSYSGGGKNTTVVLKKDGKEINIGGIYDAENNVITFTAYESGDYYIVENPVSFNDLKGYEWAEECILSLASRGIISGRGDEIFAPGESITRAEFAALAMRALKSRPGTTGSLNFNDVEEDSWYNEIVLQAVQEGIMKGESNMVFDPEGTITRQEIAVVMANILKKLGYIGTDDTLLSQFEDRDAIASWAAGESLLSVENGLIKGDNGRFKPLSHATRAETAIMLDRLYALILK
nr:S-layer homology domain-containing protein [Sedimentibacter sp.]